MLVALTGGIASGKSTVARRLARLGAVVVDADVLAREVVEPGTPAGYGRIIALRDHLIGLGAHVAAPCPHDVKCPLQAPDWCHFTQRLQRSRAHMQVKGAEVPFEDEKFAYVTLTRTTVAGRRPSRVLAQPAVSKVEITAKLCTPEGLSFAKVPRRAKADYASARRWRWGDAVS